MMLSGAMLLDWLAGRRGDEAAARAARALEAGVQATVAAGVATRDLGGTASTGQFTDAVVDAIGRAR
jgi:3-isopropylmalate dehydrogenase